MKQGQRNVPPSFEDLIVRSRNKYMVAEPGTSDRPRRVIASFIAQSQREGGQSGAYELWYLSATLDLYGFVCVNERDEQTGERASFLYYSWLALLPPSPIRSCFIAPRLLGLEGYMTLASLPYLP